MVGLSKIRVVEGVHVCDPQVNPDAQYHDDQRIHHYVEAVVPPGEVVRREPQVVHVEHHDERQRYRTHDQELRGGDAPAVIDKHHRREEHHQPHSNVNQNLYTLIHV